MSDKFDGFEHHFEPDTGLVTVTIDRAILEYPDQREL